MRSLYTSTAPAIEPVSVDEAKVFCRIDTTEDDALIASLITAARQASEHYTGRSYITQTLTYVLDTNSRFIPLPMPPFGAVSTVKYLASGTWTTKTVSTDYRSDKRGEAGVVTLLTNPSIDDRGLATVEIVYTAGYGAAAASVPAALKEAIKHRVAAMYERRGEPIEGAASSDARRLEAPYKLMTVGAGL